MMKMLKYIVMIVAACMVVTQARALEKQDQQIDPASQKRAAYVSALAKEELELTDEQTKFLEEAFYERYHAGVERLKGVNDPAKVSEIKNSIHKEFSRTVYKYYGREKSAEIIAWYYNYTNKKRTPKN